MKEANNISILPDKNIVLSSTQNTLWICDLSASDPFLDSEKHKVPLWKWKS